MNISLLNKVILVTGGTDGIGKATAMEMAKCGAKVVVTNKTHTDRGHSVVEEIKKIGGRSMYIQADVANPQAVQEMIRVVIDKFGRLDCAFNNAGYGDKLFLTADLPEDEWDKTISINLKGVWLCMKYEIEQMKRQGHGVIVNMASAGGLVAIKGSPAYTASKGAVIQLTKTAALEYSRNNIRINTVCPGFIGTPMNERLLEDAPDLKHKIETEFHAINRIGTPEEVAQAVIWLCSDESTFTTAHALTVDGGWTAH